MPLAVMIGNIAKKAKKIIIVYFMCMMTSSNGNIFRVTGHLCWEFSGHRWIPRTMNGWVNNREAGDLRRHRAHYDVTLMAIVICAIYT